MRELTCIAICALLVLFAGVGEVTGQTYQGGVRGAVRDVNGVIPGAEVILTNEETNATRTTVTNEVGEYVFSNILPGTYTIKTSLQGFKTYETKGIRIGTQTFHTIDVLLELGQIQESVTVTGQSPIIESSNPSVGSMLDKTTLETLPTAGRNPFFLSITTPNVVPSGDPQFVRQQDQTNSSLLSLGGGPRRGNNYLLEGVPITDLRNRAAVIPSIEAVEEVKVQVSTYDAEMGRTGGGVFNTTLKSGSNSWHGSVLFQNRPKWGQGRFYFDQQAVKAARREGRLEPKKPDTYFYLGGGSFGGPIRRDRTFLWMSWEGYQTKTSRNTVLTLPTELERGGDFSRTFDAQGRLIVIYDPLRTRPDPSNPGQFIRDPFAGNRIPPDRINPVAANILKFLPLPDPGRKTLPRTAELIDKSNTASLKIDHRFSNTYTITGAYAWYDSAEPESRFTWLKSPKIGDNPADIAEGLLLRTVHVVTINNILVPNSKTVLAFRYGFTQFIDDDVPNDFDAAQLGMSEAFLNVVPRKKFPRMSVEGYGRAGASLVGDRSPTDTTYYGHNVNATLSRFVGSHSLKFGSDFRVIGMKLFAQGQSSGFFSFTRGFTQGPNPLVASPTAGDGFASFLLGFPANGNIPVATPNDLHINYYAVYAQDDFRITPDLTLNFGLRYEFEQGLQERKNQMTVGFDRERQFPVQLSAATRPDGTPLNLKGGLMYAGVDGYPTHQADPSHKKFAPRGGFAWSIDPRSVLRGGYGVFWAPAQYPFPTEDRLGTRGYTAITTYVASFDGGLTPCPGCSVTNPFPEGIEQPLGNRDGLLTGAGSNIHFVDQFAKSAYVQQYSVDVQRELPGQIAVSVGYVGSRSENLGFGGTNPATVNINQVDPRFHALGPALLAPVENPFFGNPVFGSLSLSRTVPAGQLLRPYPQFLDLLAHRVSGAKARYNSLVLKGERRIHGGWAARGNYTFSRLRDNQFGEGNFFADSTTSALNNYDLEREFAVSLLDTPHRLNITGTVELPFGEGKRWLSRPGVLNAILGGWAVTGVGSYQSGFPAQVYQAFNNSFLFGSGQRPNAVPGVNPGTSGSDKDRLNNWFNPAAWTQAAPFTFGNANRTEGRVRTPFKKNWDIAIQKSQNVGGKTIMVRAEIINAFDDPNFRGPVAAFGRVDFGRVTEVGGFPRMLQLLVRVAW